MGSILEKVAELAVFKFKPEALLKLRAPQEDGAKRQLARRLKQIREL